MRWRCDGRLFRVSDRQTRCHARETSIQQLVLQVASLFWALSTYHLTLGHANPRAMPASNCTGSGDRPVEKCQINLQHSSFKKIIRSTFTYCAAPYPKHHKIQTWIAIHSPDSILAEYFIDCHSWAAHRHTTEIKYRPMQSSNCSALRWSVSTKRNLAAVSHSSTVKC